MNPKVEELISRKKEEIKNQTLKKRRQHLIKLGLVSDERIIQYQDNWDNSPECKWDREKNKYYKEIAAPIEVTDEEYEEICRYFPEDNVPVENETYGAENTLNTMATIILVIGLLSAFVLIFLIFGGVLPPIAFLYDIILVLTVLASWAILRCFANISVTLKKINAKIK